jgi:peptidoglycan hydrolase-like protein with peptidoglycan-binding domain
VTRRRLAAAGLVITACVALVGAAWPASGAGPGAAGPTDDATAPPETATVSRGTVTHTEELDGTLGYEASAELVDGLSGTYTALPHAGAVIDRGGPIAEVDGSTVARLLFGDRPAWRRMALGMSGGSDVRQLEENLVALGYAKSDRLVPDRRFDRATERAVKRWQRATRTRPDGAIELGEVVFQPGPVRVVEVHARLGARAVPGELLAATSSTEIVVTVDLAADRRGIVATGDEVSVELPDGSSARGTVTAIDSVARTAADGTQPTVGVTIELHGERSAGDLDGADVDVIVERDRREGVLTVPVDALLALREGGYAVELLRGDGTTELVAVEPGLFDDGIVEIEGDVEPGDHVVVPS